MTLAFWMILVAVLLPYVTVGFAKGGSSAYENGDPRTWAGRQDGWRKRAIAAHQNHFEAFAPFAAGVIVASIAHAPQPLVNGLAVAFILFRVIYTAIYLKGLATLRSTVWSFGLLCVIALFCAPLFD
jgi:uncharacterized MAPEG superfamily protein